MLMRIDLLQNYDVKVNWNDVEKKIQKVRYITWDPRYTKVTKAVMNFHWRCVSVYDIQCKVLINDLNAYSKYCPMLTNCDYSAQVDITDYINNGRNVFVVDFRKSPYTWCYGDIYVDMSLEVVYEGSKPPQQSQFVPPWWKYAAYGLVAGTVFGGVIVLREGINRARSK